VVHLPFQEEFGNIFFVHIQNLLIDLTSKKS